jgi:adenylate cyclase
MLRFLISNKRERQHFEHLAGPIEFGRGPERDGLPRCVIQDGYVSKDHVRVEELGDGRVKIDNLSQRNSIRLPDNSLIDKGESRTLKPPVRLTVGETLIDIEAVVDPIANAPLETIGAPVRAFRSSPPKDAEAAVRAAAATQQPPAPTATLSVPPSSSLLEIGKAPAPEKLMEWFETFIAVQRSAAGSPEFYQQTAEAVVKLVGLDRGLVILRAPRPAGAAPGQARWMVQARYPADGGNIMGREFSLTILDRVLKDRRTYFQSSATPSTAESLQGVEAVVASPILDMQENVAGFVYGCRTRFTQHRGLGIGALEAQVMQVLAASVATGLARQQMEAEASRNRVQFEQFFSPELAQELQKNPTLLIGQEREITVLFSDIRGFSRISERLGPKPTCELTADVMEQLTECIRSFDGTVVDYAGDGIMAMWNAPVEQSDHAIRACKAALAMQACLPQLDATWHERIGVPLKVGVGLNTGSAMVGNTGSRSRFKYGALGHTVNLASRTEGATKQLGVPLLITGSTRAHLGDGFAVRRLCKVRVVGIQGAVDFYELYAESAAPEWLSRRNTYEEALNLFEAAQFGPSTRTLYPLLANQEGNYDIPSLNLVTRAVEAIKNPPLQFDGVIELDRK